MSSFQDVADVHFPGHLEQGAFVERTRELLAPLGFAADNTIACVGVCREEISSSMLGAVAAQWGAPFDLASLGGLLTAGKTGFRLAHAASPLDGGRERHVYYCMPHVGIGPGGEIGQVERSGRPGTSSACGPLLAFQQALSAGPPPAGLDPSDAEQSLLAQRLSRRIKGGEVPDLLGVTMLAHRVILEDLEQTVETTVDTSRADYAVFSGVQIHTPEHANHVWPGPMYAVVSGDRKDFAL
jgi:hypothetical protein